MKKTSQTKSTDTTLDLLTDNTQGNALLTALLQVKQISTTQNSERIDGVIIGIIKNIDDENQIWISLNHLTDPIKAQSLYKVTTADIHKQCALMFENGDSYRPIIMGLMQNPVLQLEHTVEQKTLEAEHKIELQCGKASLTLHADGAIEIRGTKIVTHSSGLNHIRGASVKLN